MWKSAWRYIPLMSFRHNWSYCKTMNTDIIPNGFVWLMYPLSCGSLHWHYGNRVIGAWIMISFESDYLFMTLTKCWIIISADERGLRCPILWKLWYILQWRHNGRDGVSNHQPHHCLLNRLFRRRSKKTLKLRVTGLCREIHRWPKNSPHKWPVTLKTFPFDDVIVKLRTCSKVLWYINGLVQDWSNSSALVMELTQSCTKPSICRDKNVVFIYAHHM